MANWTNRLVVGAAVVVMAPVTARLAMPSGGGGEAHEGKAGSGRAAEHRQLEGGGGAKNSKKGAAGKQNNKGKSDDLLDPASAEQIATAETQREFNITLCTFLEQYGGSTATTEGAEPPSDAKRCSDPSDGSVEAMIAILPDPVHTHLALRFDRAVDDLQNTAQQLGWLFHRAWLPWGDLQNDDGSLRFQEKAVDAAMLKKREEQPGLILFRRGEAKRPLVVLVVGDTPTAGVNTEQFNTAVDVWASLHAGLPVCSGPCPAGTARRLMVLGPTFTGSADSLQALLQAKHIERATEPGSKVSDLLPASLRAKKTKKSTGQKLKHPAVQQAKEVKTPIEQDPQCPAVPLFVAVASGTMTSGAKLGELEKDSRRCVKVKAVSFAEDLSYQRSYLLRFLDRRIRNPKSQVAELTEDESAFGAQMNSRPTEELKRQVETQSNELEEEIKSLQKELDDAKAEKTACPDELDYETVQCLLKAKRHVGEVSQKQTNWQFDQGKLHDALRRYQRGNANLQGFSDDFQRRRGDLQLRFPRNISLLRTAYAQSGILGFGGSANNGPRTQLDLSLQEDTRDDDAVTQFAGSQSAASMESRMAQLASTLQRKQVAVAVLSATDVLDDIFVARYLQAHAPSVTVVIQDADLLFLRGGTDTSMDGMYVVSPYPLIPENVVWSHDSGNPLNDMPTLPPSQGDKGTANATRYLLCGGGDKSRQVGDDNCGWQARGGGFDGEYLWMNEYEAPFPIGEKSPNDLKLQPPLWLSVIGHGGFQPVSLIDVDQQDANFPESNTHNLPRLGMVVKETGNLEKMVTWTHPVGIRDEPMLQLYVCALILGLLLGMHGWAVCSCRLDRQFFWSYAAADAEPWAIRLGVQVGIGLLGIYALSLLLIHDQDGLQMERPWFKGLLIFMQAVTAVVNGVAAWRTTAHSKRPSRPRWEGMWREFASCKWITRRQRWMAALRPSLLFMHPRWQSVATALMLAGSGLFVLVADRWLWRAVVPSADTFSERNFFLFRSAYPINGASPLLPLLLLVGALALWMGGRMSKLVFYGCRIPKLPTKGTDVRCPCGEWTQDLESLLGRPVWMRSGKQKVNWLKLRIAGLAVALVCAVVSLSGQWGPQSLAYSAFDKTVDVLTLGIAMAVVHNLFVALVAWWLLRNEVLAPLKQSPLRWGFTWIKGFSWKRLWTSPVGFSPEAQLEYVMRNIEAERRGKVAAKDSLTQTAAAVLTHYSELVTHYGSLRQRLNGCTAQSNKPAAQWTALRQRSGCTAGWADHVAARLRDVYITLAEECDVKLTHLKVLWAKDHGPLTGDAEVRGLHNGEDPLEIKHDRTRREGLQRQADEEFVAMVYLTYIRSVMVQIRDRIGTAAGLYILLLWALTGYPWMNRHGILLQLSALLGLLAVVAILIYSEMQKDDILSRTTETQPGKLDGEFFTKILSVVGIPALTLVASQFPEFSNLIFSWLEPGLSTMR